MSKTRGGDGQFTRDPDTAARDAEACRLRTQNLSYQDIADQLGYASKSSAYDAVQRALKATVQEPAEELRQLELMQLDELARKAREVLERRHVTVSQGRVVRLGQPFIDDDGNAAVDDGRGDPIEDDAPVLAAIDRMLKIQERRAKLLGLDIPVKQLVGGDVTVTYSFEGISLDDLR
ncbi:hypothetical protein [Nonomuraea roseola]|uniref:Terminase small subunit n=1 Tax=Nonomuraea roseola TaxID=46179 RepID=A0ABV5Q4L1_9ACTN